MTNKDKIIAKLRVDNGKLVKDLLLSLEEGRKASTPEFADAPDTEKARAYIADLQKQVGALEKRVADLTAICRPDSLEQWDNMAADVAKAHADRDAWKQVAEAGIAHIHIAVGRARSETEHAQARLAAVLRGPRTSH